MTTLTSSVHQLGALEWESELSASSAPGSMHLISQAVLGYEWDEQLPTPPATEEPEVTVPQGPTIADLASLPEGGQYWDGDLGCLVPYTETTCQVADLTSLPEGWVWDGDSQGLRWESEQAPSLPQEEPALIEVADDLAQCLTCVKMRKRLGVS
jgi:hypothetical protein